MWEVDCADLSCLGGGFHLGRGRCTIDHLWNKKSSGQGFRGQCSWGSTDIVISSIRCTIICTCVA